MNSNIKKIEEILSKAEQNLRELIMVAAKEGDYLGIDTARDIAVSLNNLLNRVSVQESLPNKNTRKDENQKGKVTKTRRKIGIKRKSPAGYPKFTVRENTLVRIGWSKKAKREYQHKVTKSIFDLTIKTMGDLAKSRNGPFMAEEIIEQITENTSGSVPGYQVYVVIGLLLEKNCIDKIGREGYRFPKGFESKALNSWVKISSNERRS